MRTVGIIAEYNPFHNGHLYQLQKAKELAEAEFAVVVMSGDFTQRGTPAVFNKYMRARSALLSGADLIIELPVFGSVASAADFADCGVSLLSSMGIVDSLCFGSESGKLSDLQAAEASLGHETPEISSLIRQGVKNGLTWPQARAMALFQARDKKGGVPAPSAPNDILGVEYLRAIKKFRSPMVPCTAARCDDGYHSLSVNGSFASASAIRKLLAEGDTDRLSSVLPVSFFESLRDEPCPQLEFGDFSLILGERLLNSTPEGLRAVASMPEDLAAKLYRERLFFRSAPELLRDSKDRQYTYTRVNRCLMNLILGITKEEERSFKDLKSAPWLRILGFRRSAAPLLGQLKKQASVPMISKMADARQRLSPKAASLFEKHLKAAELYRLAAQQKTGQPSRRNEYTRSVILI